MTADDRIIRRHVDHIRSRSVKVPHQSNDDNQDDDIPISYQPIPADQATPPATLCRSTRVTRPPDRLICYI